MKFHSRHSVSSKYPYFLHRLLLYTVVRICGCGDGAMSRVGRVVGKGWGEAFNQSFEQNRYRYIEFGYRHAHNETKSAENRDLAGNPCNDTTFSKIRHNLVEKVGK